MTRTSIEKIDNMVCRGGLDFILDSLTDAYSGRQEELVIEYSAKLRGYLMALHDVGVLTTTDVRNLYLYYKTHCNK